MSDKIYIFDFRFYKKFLLSICGEKKIRRGVKAELAKAAECQPTYISQILHGKADLSLEQGERIARFLGLTKAEAGYFLLLLQKDRAATRELRQIFEIQIEEQIQSRMNVVNRLGASNPLSAEQHGIYYSSWHYLAVHMAVTVPELQTREALADFFHIGLERMDQVLEFLLKVGILQQEKNILTTGTSVIRLGKDSPHIFRHHSHWRQQAIESLERETDRDLHYSAVVTLSSEDVLRLKERMLEQIKNNIDIVKPSVSEQVYVYNIDFFNLGRR
jgi:uncharacterized protein (TIGR02147 family)